ncbi:MAG TPA: hypothetical protein VFS88_05335 [Micavibrio sp.]|nr:hypothetical protein [Micavibrio sp.]
MHPLKLALIIFLSFAYTAPAKAKSAAIQTLGNNADTAMQAAKKTWTKNGKTSTRNLAKKEIYSRHKEPRWKQQQRARNQKQSKANSGVNE